MESEDQESIALRCLVCGHQWHYQKPKPPSSFTEAEQAERRRCLERLYDMRRNDDVCPVSLFRPEFLRAMYEWAEMPRPVRVSDEIDEYDVMWWGFFTHVAWGNPEERIAQLETLEDPRAQTVIAHIRRVIDGPLPVEPQRYFYMSYWGPHIFGYIGARSAWTRAPTHAGHPQRRAE
jgi:hypothetical protein